MLFEISYFLYLLDNNKYKKLFNFWLQKSIILLNYLNYEVYSFSSYKNLNFLCLLTNSKYNNFFTFWFKTSIPIFNLFVLWLRARFLIYLIFNFECMLDYLRFLKMTRNSFIVYIVLLL